MNEKPQNVLSSELSHKETLVTNRHKTSLKMPPIDTTASQSKNKYEYILLDSMFEDGFGQRWPK